MIKMKYDVILGVQYIFNDYVPTSIDNDKKSTRELAYKRLNNIRRIRAQQSYNNMKHK